MPFLLYKTTREDEGVVYHDPIHVTLGGGGLIKTAAGKYLRDKAVGWTVSASELLTCSQHSPDQHALVVDTSPSRKTLNLFQIEAVSGYSYDIWTPIMIIFKALFADEEYDVGENPDIPVSLEASKRRFEIDMSERPRVRSFLYLTGGFRAGTWNWGGNSRTTAALLWKDAWDYFLSR